MASWNNNTHGAPPSHPDRMRRAAAAANSSSDKSRHSTTSSSSSSRNTTRKPTQPRGKEDGFSLVHRCRQSAHFAWARFQRGLLDACQLPAALILLYSSRRIQVATFKCFVLNGVILLGSIVFFRVLVLGLLSFLFSWAFSKHDDHLQSDRNAREAQSIAQAVLTALYNVLWVYPIYALSFLLNSVWYQEIADRAYAIRQVQLRSHWMRHHGGTQIQEGDSGSSSTASAPGSRLLRSIVDEVYRALLCVVYLTLATAVYHIPWIGMIVSFMMFCWLYSMYSFEYRWINQGWTLHARLHQVEDQWAYYLGFGFPGTILSYFFSTVVGGGIYALLFPLFIIMATITSAPSTDLTKRAPQTPKQRGRFCRVPVFQIATTLCDSIIRCLPFARRLKKEQEEREKARSSY